MIRGVFPYLPDHAAHDVAPGAYVRAGGALATWRVVSATEPSGPDDRRELVLEPVQAHSVPLTASVMELARPVVVDGLTGRPLMGEDALG